MTVSSAVSERHRDHKEEGGKKHTADNHHGSVLTVYTVVDDFSHFVDVRCQDVSWDASDSRQDDERMVLIEVMTKIGETKIKNQTCNEKDTTKD